MIESRDWVIESKHQVSVRKRTNHSREWAFIWLRIEPDEFGAHCFEGVGWRLSYEGHTVDALALRGEEGRSRLRKIKNKEEEKLLWKILRLKICMI